MPSSTSYRGSCTDPALEVRDLTGPADAPLVHDVDLNVRCGETVVVLGSIQSGKSTLVRHILGLDRASSGSVTVGGESFDPAARPPDRRVRRLRTRVGVVFESPALLRHVNVLENVELPLVEHTPASAIGARQTARELLHEVGMYADVESTPLELGRADQRLVALARALALGPWLLVLDEPTAGLDAHAAQQFDDTVDRLQERYGFGVLILSREVRHAFRPVQEIDVMSRGRIIARGDRASLAADENPVVRQLLHRRTGS